MWRSLGENMIKQSSSWCKLVEAGKEKAYSDVWESAR